jgi:hypothetical protein
VAVGGCGLTAFMKKTMVSGVIVIEQSIVLRRCWEAFHGWRIKPNHEAMNVIDAIRIVLATEEAQFVSD